MINLASLWKIEACGHTVLPDSPLLIGQKLVENAKIQKFKCDCFSSFQTLWTLLISNFPKDNATKISVRKLER